MSRTHASKKRLNRNLWRGATALWMTGIWIASSQPGTSFNIGGYDKLIHATVFGVLGLGSTFALGGPVRAVIAAAIWGLIDEWHQSFVPGREASALDWCADMIGALSGAGIAVWFQNRAKSRRNPHNRPHNRPLNKALGENAAISNIDQKKNGS